MATSDGANSQMEEPNHIMTLFEAALDAENYIVIETLIKSKESNPRFNLDVNECTLLATKRGDALALSRLFHLRPRMSSSDSHGKRAIHYAAEFGHLECVKLLLKQGAITNCSDDSGYTPLHLACVMGHVDIVRFLAQQCAHVNSCRTELGESAVHVTAMLGHIGVMEQLVEYGGDLNATARATKGGETPLHKAVAADKPEMVDYLLHKGANSDIADVQRKHPVHIACERGLLCCLSVLLKHGVSLNSWDSRGFSPLGVAIFEGQTEVAKILIRHCSDLNAQRCKTMSLLYMATIKCNLEIMDCLVEAGADVNYTSPTEQPAIFSAVSLGKLEAVKKLISLGADVNITDFNKNTPLHLIGGRLGGAPTDQIIQALLDAGGRLDARDHSNATPLQKYLALGVVSRQCSMVSIQLLCRAGSTLGPDEYKNGKNSPLFWLAFSGCLREALYLVRAGWELQKELWILLPGKDDRQNMLHQIMLRTARTVPSLLACCRKVLREQLSEARQHREIISSISTLPIPVPLKNYLLLTDIDPEDDSALDGVPLQDIRPLYIST